MRTETTIITWMVESIDISQSFPVFVFFDCVRRCFTNVRAVEHNSGTVRLTVGHLHVYTFVDVAVVVTTTKIVMIFGLGWWQWW
jgi:hypothetical protein